jgi:aryl-alcohol dehydrogenase-like predicted oxidoreductase
VLVATEVGMVMGRGANDSGLSRHHVISGGEASLRGLGTDHIDPYQVRGCDDRIPLDERLIYPYWHKGKTARDRLPLVGLALLGPYLT